MRDHYAVLGISPGASFDLIKAAYRKQANLLHPDKNPAADAPARFREIQLAYEILSDGAKRKAYDDFRQRSLIDDPLLVAMDIWHTYCSGIVK